MIDLRTSMIEQAAEALARHGDVVRHTCSDGNPGAYIVLREDPLCYVSAVEDDGDLVLSADDRTPGREPWYRVLVSSDLHREVDELVVWARSA